MIIRAYAVPHPPIILPEIGRGEEEKIKKTTLSFRRMAEEIEALSPDTIVLSSPHAPFYADAFFIAGGEKMEGDMRAFGAFNVRESVSLDAEFSQTLEQKLSQKHIPAALMLAGRKGLDHGSFIPIRFLHEHFKAYRLVLLGLSLLPARTHREVGQAVAEVARQLERKTVYIASGDLSHVLKKGGPYGFKKEGPEFDEELIRIFETGDFDALFRFDPAFEEKAAECGLRSFQIMAGALEGDTITPELYSYEGTFGVGYAVASFTPE